MNGKEGRKKKGNMVRARSCPELRGWEGENSAKMTRGERGGGCRGGLETEQLPLPLVGRVVGLPLPGCAAMPWEE